jgi:DivIVA domain-containing protein
VPLTPTDVANKQFRIAFRGYSLDEVDAFLDEVETELSRLLRENDQLAKGAGGAAPSTTTAEPAPPAAPSPVEPAAAPAQSEPVAAAAPAEPAALAGPGGQEAALRTLLLAQRTADEAIAEARAEAEQLLAAARSEAEQTRSSAQAEADRTLSEAQSRAASVDADIAAKVQAATGDLEQQRTALEARIEQLRAFEREYRTRLQAYLETQLRELQEGGGPDDAGRGVPPAARTAAVTGASRAGGAPGARSAPEVPRPEPTRGRAADEPAGSGREPAPREAGLRAVPPLRSGGAPVGPFTVVPSVAPAADEQHAGTAADAADEARSDAAEDRSPDGGEDGATPTPSRD